MRTLESSRISLLAMACAVFGCTLKPPAAHDLASDAHALITLTLTYQANGQWLWFELAGCTETKQILVKEPDGAGPYPVFIYTAGTTEPHDSVEATAIIEEAAHQGFVAASVEYQSGTLPQACGSEHGWYKARCVYSTTHNVQSAVGMLCARSKAAGCSHGIVAAGFSQGGNIAALARNFDTRVRGAWTMGFADRHWTGEHQPCLDYGTGPLGTSEVRLLANERLRIVRGGDEGINTAWLNQTTGRSCGAGTTDCFAGESGSGWYLAGSSELNAALNPNKHCFMMNNPLDAWGNKVDCSNAYTIDPLFAAIPTAMTYPSGMYQNISWLKNAILPLGNQP